MLEKNFNIVRSEPSKPESVRMEQFEFISRDRVLRGKIFYPETMQEKNPALLFIHGWKGNQIGSGDYASVAAKEGFIGLTFDLPGHGTSGGDITELTTEDFIAAAEAAHEKLIRSPGVDGSDITISGTSFGAYIAAIIASKVPCKNLIMRVPANYPDADAESGKPVASFTGTTELLDWRKQPLAQDATSSLRSLGKFDGNVLIVESGKDDLVPHKTVENYINAATDHSKLKHVMMPDAPHSLNEPKLWQEYEKILVDWLRETHPNSDDRDGT